MFRIILASLMIIIGTVNIHASSKTLAVTILPQQYITERIAGAYWKVLSIIPQGANPHVYEPKPAIIKELASTRYYFSLETSLDELWLKKILKNNPNLKIYRMDKNITKLEMRDHDHQHGKKLFHDPHIWLSFDNLKVIAENTYNAISEIDPDNKKIYEFNYKSLIKEIDQTKIDLTEILKDKKSRNILVFHPAWGYFAKEFSLKQIVIEYEGKEPSPKRLKDIIKLAKDNNIKAIFIQPQISSSTVELLSKELKANVIQINPLEYNVLDNLKKVAKKIAENIQ
ncbi:MAG: zinc ABC transporter substrate-binding protein [Calditerrivibrio sp.]|nr:zinc ABC transporter substrate-binding protein [Calditerrivibrio sp.]